MIKGETYIFKVEKAEPDKDFYLLSLYEVEKGRYPLYFLLEKFHSIKEHKPGDIILAAYLGEFIGKYPKVSQKVPSHIINVLKLTIPEEIRKRYGIFFSRAAALRKSHISKVGVWGEAGLLSVSQIVEILKPYLPDLKKHVPIPFFIPAGVNDIPEKEKSLPLSFVINALLPSPIENIVDYLYEPHLNKITIYLKEQDMPRFLWKDYVNIKLAAKLTKLAYVVVNVESNKEIVVDPYGVASNIKESYNPIIEANTHLLYK